MMIVLMPLLFTNMLKICTLKTIIYLHLELRNVRSGRQDPRNLRNLCVLFLRFVLRKKKGPFLQKTRVRARGVEPPTPTSRLTPHSRTPLSRHLGTLLGGMLRLEPITHTHPHSFSSPTLGLGWVLGVGCWVWGLE
jgi:hypothetical protein